MTLPATGDISLNDVNVEIQKTATSRITLNDTIVRALAKVGSTGAISMSDLRGKTYLTKEIVTAYMLEARNSQFQWCFNPEGIDGPATPASDVRFQGNPYARYVASSTATFRFPTDKHNLIEDSDNSTMAFAVTGSFPTNLVITVNDSFGPVTTTVLTEPAQFQYSDLKLYVVRVASPFKSITSASVTWNRAGDNAGSWASCVLIPGYWDFYRLGFNGYVNDTVVAAHNLEFGAAIGGGDGPIQMIGEPPANTARVTVDAAWYNNGGAWLLVNPTAAGEIFPWTGGSRGRFQVSFNSFIKP